MKPLALICWILLPCTAFGENPPLLFSAKIQKERLADEAIELLQCLAARAGSGWELAEAAGGTHWVHLEEKGNRLLGEYQTEGKRASIELSAGAWRATCDRLRPADKESDAISGEAAPDSLPTDSPKAPRSNSAWWWAGAVGIAVGGFILWSRRSARHPGIQMN